MNRLGTTPSVGGWLGSGGCVNAPSRSRHVSSAMPFSMYCKAIRALAFRLSLANRYLSVGTSLFDNRFRLRHGRRHVSVEADIAYVRFKLGGGHLVEVGRRRRAVCPPPSSHRGDRMSPEVDGAQSVDDRGDSRPSAGDGMPESAKIRHDGLSQALGRSCTSDASSRGLSISDGHIRARITQPRLTIAPPSSSVKRTA